MTQQSYCSTCDRVFSSRSALRAHNEAKHGMAVPRCTCSRRLYSEAGLRAHVAAVHAGVMPEPAPKRPLVVFVGPASVRQDWNHRCDNCGAVPTLPLTGMCGPCTFGEADTTGGEW